MIDLSHLQIELRPLTGILPNTRNSRTHSEEQVAQIAASIKEFGWTNPVLVDAEGVIIAGHARVLAARKLGMDEVPVIVLAHLTPAQRRALVIADNKLALNAGWNEEMLRGEMASLEADGFDLAVVGFPDEELRALLAGAETEVAAAGAVPPYSPRRLHPPAGGGGTQALQAVTAFAGPLTGPPAQNSIPSLRLSRHHTPPCEIAGGRSGPIALTHKSCYRARSRTPLGPWENSPYNPIVRTKSRKDRWWSRGHGTVIDDGKGNWYIIYHAYENNYYNFGRQTLIEPIEWTRDGWFRTKSSTSKEFSPRVIRNYQIQSDDFSTPKLDLQWTLTGFRTAEEVKIGGGTLAMTALPDALRVLHATASDKNYEAEVKFDVEGDVEAGLILYYSPSAFAGIGAKSGKVFTLVKGQKSNLRSSELDCRGCRHLKLRMLEHDVALYYSKDGAKWEQYPLGLEVSGYQQNILGSFTSLSIGIYARGRSRLVIDRFQYRPLDSEAAR